VDGDVTVPDGGTCELLGTRVEGNISIGQGGRLYARGVDVDGDIEGERTLEVQVTDRSNVGGNLQLESGGTAIVTGSHVDGDLSWEDQHGELQLQDTTVRGNVDVEGNTGSVTVSGTRSVATSRARTTLLLRPAAATPGPATRRSSAAICEGALNGTAGTRARPARVGGPSLPR
jgi:hypothetical protein